MVLDIDKLWEMTLNGVLKLMLGWGTEGNMDEIICHGRWRLDGLVNFAMYFVEQWGMSGGLFEGKLTHLVMALEKRYIGEAVFIDTDAFEYKDILKGPKTSAVACEGYVINFLDGKSPHTAYPFALHDTIILP